MAYELDKEDLIGMTLKDAQMMYPEEGITATVVDGDLKEDELHRSYATDSTSVETQSGIITRILD